LALALTITATVRGDNCAKGHAAYQLKSNLSGTYCSTSDKTNCNADKCDCVTCCEAKPGTCYAMYSDTSGNAKSCDNGKMFDKAKAATTTKTDTFSADCCKDTPNATTSSTCLSKKSAAMADSKFCDTGKVVPTAKEAETVMDDLTNYKAKCCEDEVLCATATCSDGHKDKSDKANIKCTAKPCDEQECCDVDPAKCAGVMGQTCGDDKYMDPAKKGAAATASDYKTQCCTDKATCEDFKAATTSGGSSTTSAATQKHVGATLSLLIGGFVMGKHA